jgi:mitogen-activated protein kinase organizer 1
MNTVPIKEINTLKGHTGAVNIVSYNKDGTYAITGAGDKLVKLWNPVNGLCVKTYAGHGWEVLDIKMSVRRLQDRVIAFAYNKLTLQFYRPICIVICRAPDNTKFASVGGDRSALLWDVATGKVIRRFSGHGARINSVDMNSDGTVIVTGSYDATIRCWDCR